MQILKIIISGKMSSKDDSSFDYFLKYLCSLSYFKTYCKNSFNETPKFLNSQVNSCIAPRFQKRPVILAASFKVHAEKC